MNGDNSGVKEKPSFSDTHCNKCFERDKVSKSGWN